MPQKKSTCEAQGLVGRVAELHRRYLTTLFYQSQGLDRRRVGDEGLSNKREDEPENVENWLPSRGSSLSEDPAEL